MKKEELDKLGAAASPKRKKRGIILWMKARQTNQ